MRPATATSTPRPPTATRPASARPSRPPAFPREELFITTKLRNGEQGPRHEAFQNSRKALALDFVDLYLIHWPVPSQGLFTEAWKEMERCTPNSQIRAIGVSNFLSEHWTPSCEAADVVPAVNQIELHPSFQQAELAAKCRALGIAVEAYSPLGQGADLNANAVTRCARHTTPPPPRWSSPGTWPPGTIVIPKSADSARMRENFAAATSGFPTTNSHRSPRWSPGARIGADPAVAAFTPALAVPTDPNTRNRDQHQCSTPTLAAPA